MPTTSLTFDRCVLAAAVVTTCVLFTAQAADPVNVVKLTALLLCALAIMVSGLYRATRYRVLQLPWGLAPLVALALVLALVVATAVAPVTSTAVLGTYGRNSGLLAYGSAMILLFVGLRTLQRPHTAVLVGGVVLAGLFTATYGLLQKAGIDTIEWNNPFNPIIAALGNPNFASGYLGVAASVAVGGTLWSGWGTAWRAICGVTAVLALAAAALSSSVQGPIAAAAGLFVIGLTVILNSRSTMRRPGLTAAAIGAVASLALLMFGAISKAGPAAAIFSDSGSKARVYYWEAALEMFQDQPIFGVGLDQYGNYWRTARSPESVDFLGGSSFSDAAHSVPLQIIAQGGVLLGATYLAFLAVTAWALVRGLVRLTGADRVLLGTVGAGWTAYQVQSFVSIDQVPLLVLHFTLAAAVLAASGQTPLKEIRLPGSPKPVTVNPNDARARRRVAAAAPVPRALSGTDVAVLTGVGVAALIAVWFSFVPLRANMALHDGDQALQIGNGNEALDLYQKASNLVPGISVYWNRQGSLNDQVSRPEAALEAYEAAVAHDPYDVNAVNLAAIRSETAGRIDDARRYYTRAARLDPLNGDTVAAAAMFELRHSGAERARTRLESTVTKLPTNATVWATLGDARAVLGDRAGAKQAYERALVLQPGQPVAAAGLQKLTSPTPS